MSADEFADFVSQMHLLVLEEAPIWEIPVGSIDRLPSGHVHHGPFDAADCSIVLSIWNERGLMDLWPRSPTGQRPLARTAASQLLLTPSEWILDAGLDLAPTDAGQQLARVSWFDLVPTRNEVVWRSRDRP